MVVLRRVQKLASRLPGTTITTAPPDTALGDWYVSRIVVDRRPLLLLVEGHGLLPMLVPAREVSLLPRRLRHLVAARLRRLGVPEPVIAAETAVMDPVLVGPTADRSVVGTLVDFAKAIPLYLTPGAWDDTALPFLEARLAQTPCRAGRRFEEVIFPDRKAPELLFARWGEQPG